MEEQKPTPPTLEEIAKYEIEMTKYYEEKLPFLRLKAEYDTLSADIAEARVRTSQANNMFMRMKMDEADAKKEAAETHKSSTDGDKG